MVSRRLPIFLLPLLIAARMAIGQEPGESRLSPGSSAPPSSTEASPPTATPSTSTPAAAAPAAPAAAPTSDDATAPSRPTGGPTRPAASDVGIGPRAEAEVAAQESPKADTRYLSKFLGLEESPVQIYGWIQNSYTATPGFNPRNRSTVTVFPNRLANEWQGNQFYFVLENMIEANGEANLGFRLDTLFGNDWMYTHSFGLFNGAFTPRGFPGVDFPQIYGDLHLPVLFEGGVDIRGGRFYSPAGFESVMAVKRPLLSVPYVLNYTPFTFLGALATFHPSERFTFSSGAANGADRWFDTNYHPSYLGALHWVSKSGKTTLNSTLLVGPNQLPFFPSTNLGLVDTIPLGVYTSPELENRRNPFYNRSTLVYLSNTLVLQWNDRLTEAAEIAYVTESNVLGLGPRGGAIRAEYYGFAHHFLYEFNDHLTGVFRAEIFRDDDGLATGFADTFHELTLGALIKPHPWLWVRPEIRYDWAQFTHPYDDGTRKGQLTLATDIVIQF
jgi:hypothetical protein